MTGAQAWIVVAIASAEVAFWVLLALGLTARYVLKLRRVSSALLLCVPLVDLALIILVSLDLSRGAEPTDVHGLAALYLGISVGFGPRMIRAADARFAHRFANGPPPPKPPLAGPARIRHEWHDYLRMTTAWLIAVTGLALMKAISGWSIPSTFEQVWNDEMWAWAARITLVNLIWLISGPIWALTTRAPADTKRKESS